MLWSGTAAVLRNGTVLCVAVVFCAEVAVSLVDDSCVMGDMQRRGFAAMALNGMSATGLIRKGSRGLIRPFVVSW